MNNYADKNCTTMLKDFHRRRDRTLFCGLCCVCSGPVPNFEKPCSGKNWVTDTDIQNINMLPSKSTSQAISRPPAQLLICRKWFIDAQREACYEVAFFKC